MIAEKTRPRFSISPFLDVTFGTLLDATGKWTTTLDDTRDAGTRLLVPDYSVTTRIGAQECSVLMLEGKTASNSGSGQVWDDLTKLEQELKYALDTILKQQPGKDVCTIGVLVRGYRLDFTT